MPAQELEHVKKSLSEQDGRIKSLEDTVHAVLPPLFEKIDKTVNAQHEVCLEIRDLINQMAANSKDMIRVSNRMDKLEINHTTLKEEVIENRPLVKLVKGLGTRIFWFAFVIAGAAFAIILTAVDFNK